MTKTMVYRICQVISSLSTGGMERMVCDLLAGMQGETLDHRRQTTDQRGRQPVASCLFCTDTEGELYATAPAEAKACGHRKPGWLIVDWRLVRRLTRFVRKHRIQLLHAHNHAPNLYCTIVSLLTGIPMIVTRHGQGYKTLRWKILTRLLALRAKKVVFVSEDAKRVAMATGSVSPRKAMVIHNGVDTRRFSPGGSGVRSQESGVRKKLGIPDDAVVIGSVGRLSPEKNYPLLVRSFAQVAQKKTLDPRPETIDLSEALGGRTSCEPSSAHGSDKPFDLAQGRPRPPRERSFSDEDRSNVYSLKSNVSLFLLLIGDGPDRARIEEEIQRQGVAGLCHITGMQSEVLPWLQSMDIFCLSSDTEGLSISLLEAGACGIPSVVTDVGGNQEVVADGRTGFVVKKMDENGIAHALGRLVCNADVRRAIGVAAQGCIARCFSREKMISQYMMIYHETLRGNV